ncbi:zinc-dependent alcohol dehydrogenase family protein [Aliikangiella marina]|uniref:Zinc-dependent alcohol dehydrogenase family protein n=1 Tax=Aliikangiella marina TaxID=1712262 RepID=A0A545TDE5_9GAMM|nr:zinc-dependent alcohol dehydrogenase family protein [Aliikangiella marina]TQV75211.1 zinc-dependent alcohol dehydrogenase family protein [Aliikangiella marina]
MKAMIIDKFGGTEFFKQVEVNKPVVKPGHVVVKVKASSVNPVDYKIRSLGDMLPFAPVLPAILGMDFAGVIEEVGEGVTEFQIGDEVFGCAGGLGTIAGSLAEYMLADSRLIAKKPNNISMQQAAALPLVSITAYEGLSRAGVSEGQKVLIHGGSGGVGHIAVQLAQYFGAQVYSTAGGDKQIAYLENLGVKAINYKSERVEDYTEQYTEGKGFDLIFDSVGDQNLTHSIEAAKLNGHIATTSSMVEMDLTLAHLKGLSLHVIFMLIPMIHNTGREQHGRILTEIARIVEAGKLMPYICEPVFSLAQIADAHQFLESGRAMGKVVVNHE